MITSCITISNNLSLKSGTEGKEDVILSRLTLGKLNLFSGWVVWFIFQQDGCDNFLNLYTRLLIALRKCSLRF